MINDSRLNDSNSYSSSNSIRSNSNSNINEDNSESSSERFISESRTSNYVSNCDSNSDYDSNSSYSKSSKGTINERKRYKNSNNQYHFFIDEFTKLSSNDNYFLYKKLDNFVKLKMLKK